MKTNTTAVITGASRGLGLALAHALAARNWQLVVDARGGEALFRAVRELPANARVRAIAGDVSEEGHRAELAQAARELGGVDLLVNNAGILGPSPQPELLDYPPDILAEVYRINVLAPLGLIQTLRPAFNPGATIINISSDAAVEAYAGWGGYGSAKAALEHISAVLAVENPDWKVLWVDPGDMRTAMHQAAFPQEDISDRPLPDASIPGLLSLIGENVASGRYRLREVQTLQEAVS